MAFGHAGRTLTMHFRSMGKGRDHAVDGPGTRFSHRACKQPPSARQKAESTARDEPKDFTPARAAVIGQWNLLHAGCRLYRLRSLWNLCETRRMAGVDLCADVADHGTSVPFSGMAVDASWMGQSQTVSQKERR
jgi:hypothetical protein